MKAMCGLAGMAWATGAAWIKGDAVTSATTWHIWQVAQPLHSAWASSVAGELALDASGESAVCTACEKPCEIACALACCKPMEVAMASLTQPRKGSMMINRAKTIARMGE